MGKTAVLIIEDDKFFRDLISKRSAKENFEVLSAGDWKEAMEILKEKTPDVILLDLVLPGFDGFEILNMIKTEEKTKNTPVIIVSNLGQKEEIEKAKALGATDFMIKINFTPEQIVEKIKNITRARAF